MQHGLSAAKSCESLAANPNAFVPPRSFANCLIKHSYTSLSYNITFLSVSVDDCYTMFCRSFLFAAVAAFQALFRTLGYLA